MNPILIYDASINVVERPSSVYFDKDVLTKAQFSNPLSFLNCVAFKNIVIKPTGLYDVKKKPIYEFHMVKGVVPEYDEEGEPTGKMEEAVYTVLYDDNYARFVLEIQDEMFSFEDYEKILDGKLSELEVIGFDYELLKEMAG